MEVSLVIPAFNEEENIAEVLAVSEKAKNQGLIDEIVVVDDGSTDKTAEVAEKFDVKVIKHPGNFGKGAAIQTGIDNTKGEIVMLLDADLVDFKTDHFRTLLEPLEKENVAMTIGLFQKTTFSAWFGNLIPSMSGQRAIRRELCDKFQNLEKTGYGVDYLITKTAKKGRGIIKIVPLDGVSQRFKESKNGILSGIKKRYKMYEEIFKQMGE